MGFYADFLFIAVAGRLTLMVERLSNSMIRSVRGARGVIAGQMT